MPSLSSLVVQRHVATVQEVEQAIARQVIHGGDLVTNLLEVAPACEPVLVGVLAESLGLAAAPAGRLPAPDQDVLEAVPAELALGHGLFPLRKEGAELVVASSTLVSLAAEQALEAALGVKLRTLASPLIRVREAIAAQYGIPLDARQLKLVKKLDAVTADDARVRGDAAHIIVRDTPGVSGTRPLPKAPSLAPSTFASGIAGAEEIRGIDSYDRPSIGPSIPPSDPEARLSEAAPTTEEDVEPAGAAPPADAPPGVPRSAWEPAVDDQVIPPLDALPSGADGKPSALVAGADGKPAALVSDADDTRSALPNADDVAELTRRAPEAIVAPTPEPPVVVEDLSPPPPNMIDRRAIDRLLRREVLDRKGRDKSARRKGPFARSDAERELEEAASADTLIDVVFAFGSQYFEYSALFRVHGDIAEGRDAWGPGASRDKVVGIGIPLDLPGSFSEAKSRAAMLLTRMNVTEIDKELVRDLGRERAAAKTRTAAVVPLTLRGRAVALLYGEDGDSDVTVTQIGDLVGFLALASKHLERIAVAKKLGAASAPAKAPRSNRSSAPPPPSATKRALLERWQKTVRDEASGTPPADPPPLEARVSSGAESLPPVAPVLGSEDANAAIAYGATVLGPRAMSIVAPLPLPPMTRPYDDGAFGPTAGMGQFTSSPPAERVETVPGAGNPETITQPRLDGGRPHVPIPREEDDDASRWLVEQGGSPEPPAVRRESPTRGEYLIIPDRGAGGRPETDTQRAREAALFGPYGALLMKATLGGIQAEEALSELAREADHSLPKIVAAFPGPLLVDRFRMRDQLPPASQCGPLLKLLVMLRKASLGFMTVRGASSEPEQRFWATHVLGELLFPEASTAVLPRLFDDDVMVRRVARRAAIELVNAGAPGEPLKQSLTNMIGSADEPIHRWALAIETLGEIRAAALLPALIAVLDSPHETLVEAARRALLLIARQDFGPSSRDWTAWWDENREKRRVEWLIDALTHETPSLRRAAGDELKQITNEYFGYYDDLPPRDRERAQQKYRDWWSEEGQFRFRA